MTSHALLTLALLSLFASDIAQAQQMRPDNGAPGGRPGAGAHGGRPEGGARPERPGPVTRPSPGRPEGGRPGGPGNGGPQIQPPRPERPTPPRPQPPRPDRPQRPMPPHRPGVRPPHFRPIHASPFRYPRGYAYRRWTVGVVLPLLFRSSTYYYNDYAALGVGPPAPGYRWVRHGPDLLEVNIRTGRIADIIYGAFY